MAILLKDARIVTPDEEIGRGSVLISHGRIEAVGEVSPPADVAIFDLAGLTLLPGFIDLHVHGGGGFSLATRDAREVRSYARWTVSRGVTSFLATICAASLEEAVLFLRTAADAAGEAGNGANLLGLNLEGPFLNPERRGALPPSWMAPPDVGTFGRLAEAAAGHLRLLTLAPEMPDADQVLSAAVAAGAKVAIGHTDAAYDAALRAFNAGASHLTHAFNAMRPFHHRDPGPVGAATALQQVTVELIADGVHLHPATVDMLIRIVGPERLALVTDALPPAGLPSGFFRLGDEEARLQGDRVLLPGGRIAGGAATMDRVVRNLLEWGCAGLGSTARMASTVPAAVAGAGERKGRIARGYDADLVALDTEFQVVMTWVGGRLLYSRSGAR